MPSLHIRELGTNKLIHSVPLRSTSGRYVDKVMMGMLRKVNLNEYWIDDSEFDEEKSDAG